ncbi:MAG: hypothetical protein A2427_00430 [Candidatus Nealsonbacteria bacterium RIFOXYC1_FULL_40_7]|uniref:Uncharacterized protein n=2 Tax=Patescibacteria group TaxID=1783273 RepID=A0A1G2EQZ6_9BACT|nr:MAG: hypothetical protein A2363_00140 [Candidatus Gottesmanbacteria bacterium RIFOXYB1_FULL_47_11]OGZ27972.1 MAG: hypothetical protein A2427_00430 [Candidatus Nealsonbacteria bacterium RIFOXYC1_FULL_40_7]
MQTKLINYRETAKFNLWAKYFTDASNKDTWGNATQSAIIAYKYSSPGQYHLASITGSKNMRKYELLAPSMLDKIGFSFGELLKIGVKKMLDGNYKDWDALMERLGYFEGKDAIQQNNQYNQFNFEEIGQAIAQSRKERGLAY